MDEINEWNVPGDCDRLRSTNTYIPCDITENFSVVSVLSWWFFYRKEAEHTHSDRQNLQIYQFFFLFFTHSFLVIPVVYCVHESLFPLFLLNLVCRHFSFLCCASFLYPPRNVPNECRSSRLASKAFWKSRWQCTCLINPLNPAWCFWSVKQLGIGLLNWFPQCNS